MKNKTTTLLLSLSFVFMLSCSHNSLKDCDCYKDYMNQKTDQEYDSLVKVATWRYIGTYQMTNDSSLLDSAIILLDKAIEHIPVAYGAYQCKLMVLNTQRQYQEIMDIVDQLLEMGYELPDLYYIKARMFDELGEPKKADELFEKTRNLYDGWLECFPDSMALVVANVCFVSYADGKEEGLETLRQELKKHPNELILQATLMQLQEEPEDSWYFRQQ